MIAGVLLIPVEGDPLKLLAEGPCGARPPMAGRLDGYWYECESDGDIALYYEDTDSKVDTDALVLAWDGKPVAAGLIRIMLKGDTMRELKSWCRGALKGLRRPVPSLMGTIVLIDADGEVILSAEVTDE